MPCSMLNSVISLQKEATEYQNVSLTQSGHNTDYILRNKTGKGKRTGGEPILLLHGFSCTTFFKPRECVLSIIDIELFKKQGLTTFMKPHVLKKTLTEVQVINVTFAVEYNIIVCKFVSQKQYRTGVMCYSD